MMRVCQFSSTTIDTHYFASIGTGLAARDIPAVWVTLADRPPPAWVRGLASVEVCSLDTTSRWQWPLAAAKLARVLRRRRVDVLQTHLYHAGLIGALAAKWARTPLTVLTRHHMDQVHMMGTRAHVAADRWMARASDVTVVPSEAVRTFMSERERLDPARIAVVPYGFDFQAWTATPEDRARVRHELGLDGAFVVGCVASFSPTKGHAYLLDAMAGLAAEQPDLRLLFVGAGDRAAIDALVTRLGIHDRVVCAGFRRDVAACMAAMDLLVHPSLSESFCQVLVESQAVGTPVVAARVGGVPEVVRDGVTGVLVPPADSRALADAIRSLRQDPARRQQFADAGRVDVRTRFDAARMVDAYVAGYTAWRRRA